MSPMSWDRSAFFVNVPFWFGNMRIRDDCEEVRIAELQGRVELTEPLVDVLSLPVRSQGATGPSTALNVELTLTGSRLLINCNCFGSRWQSFCLRCVSSYASCPLVTEIVKILRGAAIFETSKW
jgi:hypothetical protein